MKNNQKIVFTSDIHFSENSIESIQNFINFCIQLKELEVDYLYILGDLFDKWLELYQNETWVMQISHALISTNCKNIFFIKGNRDFTISENTLSKLNAKLIDEDYVVINHFDKNILICHGDTLCIDDKKYILFRKIIRNKILLSVLSKFPLFIQKKIASNFSSRNKKKKQVIVYDANEDFCNYLIKKYKVDYMIHGHVHKEYMKTFKYENKISERLVLGSWDNNKITALLLTEDGYKYYPFKD